MEPDVINLFESMRSRRALLETLTHLSCQLNAVSEGLSSVQQIIRPSQQFSSALAKSLDREIDLYRSQDTPILQQKLTSLNTVIEKACVLFFRVAKMDDQLFIRNFHSGEAQRELFIKLQEKLNLSQKQIQHSLAIRILLQERGVQLERSKLTINQQLLNQELLMSELTQLKTREKQHRDQLRKEVVSMLSDTEQLLTVAQGHEVVQMMLVQNADHLKAALILIDSGESLKMLPFLIEDIQCDLLPEGFYTEESPEQLHEVKPIPISASSKKVEIQKRNSFIYRVFLWVTTSFDVGWDDTEYFSRKNSTEKFHGKK